MLVELIVLGTVSYLTGRSSAKIVDETLEYVESQERCSTHSFGGAMFEVKTNDEYRMFREGVDAITQMVNSVKLDLELDSVMTDCYRICLVRGVISWGVGGDASYTSLVKNLEESHVREYVGATKKAWDSLHCRQVRAMFCLAHFSVPD